MLEEFFEPVVKYKGQASEKMQTTSFPFESKIASRYMQALGRQFLPKLSSVQSYVD